LKFNSLEIRKGKVGGITAGIAGDGNKRDPKETDVSYL
jgi:hypothetical protein